MKTFPVRCGLLACCVILGMSSPRAHAIMLSSERIAYVDMGRVMEEYKAAKDARARLAENAARRKEEIFMKEKELELNLNQISTVTGLASPSQAERRRAIESLHDAYMLETTLQNQQMTRDIMAVVYEAIRKIAQQEGYAIVLDRRQVLYSQDNIDLTEVLLDRLNRDYAAQR